MNASEIKSKLSKAVDFLKSELSQVRTGRATPALIENIPVDVYESKMTVKELGTITLLDNQNLAVIPWDKTILKSISKAIRESGIGLNPIDEPDRVRVPVPSLNEERRNELIRLVSTKVEESKNAIRSIRQDTMKAIEKDFTDKNISEDDKFSQKEEVEKIVKSFIEETDALGENKKKELSEI